MTWLKRSGGVLAILLGILGIAACLVGTVKVWSLRGQIDDLVAVVSSQVDDALARLEGHSRNANQYISEAQDSVRELNARVKSRVAKSRDVPLEEAADIDQIERQLYARVQLAQDVIGFIGSTLELVEQLSTVVQSASTLVKKDSRTIENLVVALRDGRQELRRTSSLTEEVKTAVAEIRKHRDVEENAKRITTLSSVIDKSLTKVKQHTESFDHGVVNSRAAFVDLATRIRQRLLAIALVLTLILVWIAVAQLALAVHGWRAFYLRPPGSKYAPTAD
jgi:archaellum component FlaC